MEYVYVRVNHWQKADKICKLGYTANIPDRNNAYLTHDYIPGEFVLVIEVDKCNGRILEKTLQREFIRLNIRKGGGVEYYDDIIIPLIEPFVKRIGLKHKVLTKEEIKSLSRTVRKQTHKKEVIKDYIIRSDQQIIIDNTCEYLTSKDKGILCLICGIGKTLISLWISMKLGFNRILIGVPNLILLNQWYNVIRTLMGKVNILKISGNTTYNKMSTILSKNKCVMITTYASSYKLMKCYSSENNKPLDIKILDEVHHLTSANEISREDIKQYVKILSVPSIKQLGLTATMKNIDYTPKGNDNIISNNNTEYFGEVIEHRNMLWGIENNIICDYMIQTLVFSSHTYVCENDNDLKIAVIAALQSITQGYSHHLLIYCNTQDNAQQLNEYIRINELIQNHEVYHSCYTSNMTKKEQEQILKDFEQSVKGILVCVYCLGEGWDLPLLDGVVFAENMSSNIRIVQSLLRASRKDSMNPDKINKVIIPVYSDAENENWEGNNFKKIREVLYQISLEDENVIQKLNVYKVKEEPENTEGKERYEPRYDETMTQDLRLKSTTRLNLGLGYKKAVSLLAEYNLKNKKEYYELCDVDVRFPKDPEKYFGNRFKNWVDYLSINIGDYYDLETCKIKINEYLLMNSDIRKIADINMVLEKLNAIDEKIPNADLIVNYYNICNLKNIFIQTGRKRR